MRCTQARKKLANLLAGECTPSEESRILAHLKECRQCANELSDLKAVDTFLDMLGSEEPPQDLFDSIMGSVGEPVKTSDKYSHSKERSFISALSRDLVAAAAVTLTVFWLGSSWLSPLKPTAENRVSEAVLSYVHYTGMAMDLTQQTIEELNKDLSSTTERLKTQKYENREVIE